MKSAGIKRGIIGNEFLMLQMDLSISKNSNTVISPPNSLSFIRLENNLLPQFPGIMMPWTIQKKMQIFGEEFEKPVYHVFASSILPEDHDPFPQQEYDRDSSTLSIESSRIDSPLSSQKINERTGNVDNDRIGLIYPQDETAEEPKGMEYAGLTGEGRQEKPDHAKSKKSRIDKSIHTKSEIKKSPSESNNILLPSHGPTKLDRVSLPNLDAEDETTEEPKGMEYAGLTGEGKQEKPGHAESKKSRIDKSIHTKSEIKKSPSESNNILLPSHSPTELKRVSLPNPDVDLDHPKINADFLKDIDNSEDNVEHSINTGRPREPRIVPNPEAWLRNSQRPGFQLKNDSQDLPAGELFKEAPAGVFQQGYESEELLNSIGAVAAVEGGRIHLARDAPGPSTTQGRAIIAHEITHAYQQEQFRQSPTLTAPGIEVLHQMENEALDNEARVLAGKEPSFGEFRLAQFAHIAANNTNPNSTRQLSREIRQGINHPMSGDHPMSSDHSMSSDHPIGSGLIQAKSRDSLKTPGSSEAPLASGPAMRSLIAEQSGKPATQTAADEGGLDLAAISEHVYEYIIDRLQIELERRGI